MNLALAAILPLAVVVGASTLANAQPTKAECEKASKSVPSGAEIQRMNQRQKDAAKTSLEESLKLLKQCLNAEVKTFLEKVSEPVPKIGSWAIHSQRDRLSDTINKTASVKATSPDNGVSARIDVFCLGFKDDTKPVISVETSASFLPGRMGLRYRLDTEEAEERFMPVNSSGRGMSLWAQPTTFFGKKQLRVELQPYRSRNLFFEFDISGSEQAIRGLGCKRLED